MLNVKIATPDATLYDGTTNSITVKTIDGVMNVLPRHVPVISPIVNGYYKIDDQQVDVANAMLIITDKSEVTILISKLEN